MTAAAAAAAAAAAKAAKAAKEANAAAEIGTNANRTSATSAEKRRDREWAQRGAYRQKEGILPNALPRLLLVGQVVTEEQIARKG
jgi:beta-glucosidase/6-phospho-beta-glucosidase/beta-galactosidase